MPCDSIITTEPVPFTKVQASRLAEALKDEGWSVSQTSEGVTGIRYKAGYQERFSLQIGAEQAVISSTRQSRTPAAIGSEIKRAYAIKTVAYHTQKYGFSKKSEKTEAGRLSIGYGKR